MWRSKEDIIEAEKVVFRRLEFGSGSTWVDKKSTTVESKS